MGTFESMSQNNYYGYITEYSLRYITTMLKFPVMNMFSAILWTQYSLLLDLLFNSIYKAQVQTA